MIGFAASGTALHGSDLYVRSRAQCNEWQARLLGIGKVRIGIDGHSIAGREMSGAARHGMVLDAK